MPRYPETSSIAEGLSARVYTSFAALAAAHAPEVFALNVGDTYLEPPLPARCEALCSADLPGIHAYAPVIGEPALLDAICVDLAARERPVARDALQVTAGATSGLDLVCRLLFTRGDEVLVLAPFWPLIRGIVANAGAMPVEVPYFSELARPDFDAERALEQAITPRTAAIYVNSPHNPTGVVLDAAHADMLARVLRRHDLWLISDEAYEKLWFDAAPAALWMHPELEPRAFVAHTFSKCFGMAGARVGFVHGPSAALSKLQDLQAYATYCAPRPMQQAVLRALTRPEGSTWSEQARALYREAAEKTAQALGLPRPASGTFLAFDVRPYLRPGESVQALLERIARRGVVLTPGRAIGAAYADWARLCYTAVSPDRLERALAILKEELH